MAILDSGVRTTAVVADDGRLVGVVTEGDVVRAIARGSGPGLTAEDVMNLSPDFLLDPASIPMRISGWVSPAEGCVRLGSGPGWL